MEFVVNEDEYIIQCTDVRFLLRSFDIRYIEKRAELN